MEAPRSLKQKEGEPTMSYINKGKYKTQLFTRLMHNDFQSRFHHYTY